jgi:hypothetical protein
MTMIKRLRIQDVPDRPTAPKSDRQSLSDARESLKRAYNRFPEHRDKIVRSMRELDRIARIKAGVKGPTQC